MASMLDREIDGEYHKEYEQGEERRSQVMEKLDEANDPPENLHVIRNLSPSHIHAKQDNLEDPEVQKDSNIFEASM